MAHLTFVVKSQHIYSAQAAVDRRGIIAHPISAGVDFVTFLATMEYFDKVSHWFCEHDEIIPGFGCPEHTCLIYSTHESN